MNTPWGKSDSKTTLAKGLSWVGTPSHGGFAITPSAALKYLSTAAVSRALKYGSYYFFEEDCDYAIVMLELLPTGLLSKLGGIPTREDLIASLSRWHADYLIESEITPTDEGLKFFNDNRKADCMRRDKSPDLIVAAYGEWADWVPKGRTGVVTAAGERWTVPASEYSASPILNLLSNYSDVKPVTSNDVLVAAIFGKEAAL